MPAPAGGCVPREEVTPRFFASVAAFRRWLRANHDRATELYVGYHKKHSGKGGLTYPEALDEALCWGWIDGVVRTIDADSYHQRWTPRTRDSQWSAVNIRKVAELTAAGRMQPPGIAAFERRNRAKDATYSYERAAPAFDAEQERAFKRNRAAWRFWEGQPPGYRRLATHHVTSAKKPETRARRLATLIACSAAGRRLPGA
jgi:uncharacterized protein YdeI (YjbR/CyaY-like superfamily)